MVGDGLGLISLRIKQNISFLYTRLLQLDGELSTARHLTTK